MSARHAEPDTALTSRLRAAASVLTPDWSPAGDGDAGELLEHLVEFLRADLRRDRIWLVYTVIATAFPTNDELRAAERAIELGTAHTGAMALLDMCLDSALRHGSAKLGVQIVSDAVLVDVDFSARHDVNTGVQRVVRCMLPHWVSGHEVRTAVWTPAQGILRTLTEREQDRVLRWREWRELAAGQPDSAETGRADTGSADGGSADTGSAHAPDWTLLVPWRSVVVVAEVPPLGVCTRLAALAEHSGNDVVAIGYDCIPVVSADLVPLAEPNRFVKYLAAVKHMSRVAGISISATAEFAGFAAMLNTQGLPGPKVVECALPSETPRELPAPAPRERPLVMCVGSFEPRKNQLGVLYAAEVLWREGLDFELRFIGGGGVSRQFPGQVARLARRGRPVSIATAITDTELEETYAAARFSVFASVHEGYGLPIAESLAHGTPVITSDYGSTREIAMAGGTLLVDPREDDALVDAMRRLLTDDVLLTKTREEITHRPNRTWADYAAELWQVLVEPDGRREVPA